MSFLSRIKSGVTSPGFRRAELGALFILLTFLFVRRIDYVQFYGDESFWISDSRYFDVLLSGDFSAEAWADTKVLSDQPPVPRYLIGLSRRLAGYQVRDLSAHYVFSDDYQTNEVQGRVPSAGLLWWSRLPMAVLAAVSGVTIFWLLAQAFSRLAGYLWLFQYVGSYFITATLCRAMGESPLLAMSALAGVCGVFALREFRKVSSTPHVSIWAFRYSLFWFLLLGVCSGLAAASKLNGALAVGAGFLLIIWAVLKYGSGLSKLQRGLLVLTAGGLPVIAAGATFLIINPFLYRDTVNHALLFYTKNFYVLARYQQKHPEDRIDGISERLEVVPDMVLRELAFTGLTNTFWPNLALNGFGVAGIFMQLRRWRQDESRANAGLTVLALALTVGAPPLFTAINVPRYYFLPVIFSLMFAALGLAQLIEVAYAYVRRRLAARGSPQPGSMD